MCKLFTMYKKEEFVMNPRKRRLFKLKATIAKAAAKEVVVKPAPAPTKVKPAPVKAKAAPVKVKPAPAKVKPALAKKAFGKTKAKK